jgi:WASH complex subunit CCDC53
MARKVGPQLDFTEVEPVPYRKTLTFVNTFIIHTVHFLNRFAALCEEKLMEVSTQVEQLEITMNLLEAKLQSIPEAAFESSGPTSQQTQQQSATVTSGEQHTPHTGNTVKDDPRYAKYFTMLRIGIPIDSVQQKMMMDGVDPSILSNPDAPLSQEATSSISQPLPPVLRDNRSEDSSETTSDNDDEDWSDDEENEKTGEQKGEETSPSALQASQQKNTQQIPPASPS